MANPLDSKYDSIRNTVINYANKYGIDTSIAIWQIWQESSFNPNASSGKANGIAQFTPATAARFGVNVSDVNSSLDGWGQYMSFLLNRYNGDYSKALAGYNSGEGNVDKYGGIPPFTETQNYVKTILTNAGKSNVLGVVNITDTSDNTDTANILIFAGIGLVILFLID